MMQASLPVKIGMLLGLAFFVHAMVPNSNAWPLIWPIVAGSLAVWLAARRGSFRHFGQGVGAAVRAGAVAGAFFFIATAVALWLLSSGALEPLERQLGAERPIVLSSFTLAGLALAALIGTVLAALSGAATYPFTRRNQSQG